jgi:hypothetical protein
VFTPFPRAEIKEPFNNVLRLARTRKGAKQLNASEGGRWYSRIDEPGVHHGGSIDDEEQSVVFMDR